MRSVVTRHPVVAFVVLAYAISWCMLPFGTFIAGGPLVAAVLVTALVDGWRGLRRLGGRIVRWRVSWVWYAAAIALPVAAHAVTLLGIAATGGPAPSLLSWSPWYSLLLVAAVRLVNPLDGPLGEEPAWRGFAQPRLQATRSPLRATGILCLAVTTWHLPLYFIPEFGLRPFEALTTVACTVVFAWLFNRSGGSVLIPLLAHVVEGTSHVSDYWSADADVVRGKAWYSAAWVVMALALLAFDRRAWVTAPASARDDATDGDGRPPGLPSPLAGLTTERTRHEHAGS
jgi:membrane protease YdiL (CAAX protease family)